MMNDMITLLARVKELEQSLAEKQKIIHLACQDSAEDEIKIEDICRPIIGKDFINGDSIAVPGIVEVVRATVENLTAQLHQRETALNAARVALESCDVELVGYGRGKTVTAKYFDRELVEQALSQIQAVKP